MLQDLDSATILSNFMEHAKRHANAFKPAVGSIEDLLQQCRKVMVATRDRDHRFIRQSTDHAAPMKAQHANLMLRALVVDGISRFGLNLYHMWQFGMTLRDRIADASTQRPVHNTLNDILDIVKKDSTSLKSTNDDVAVDLVVAGARQYFTKFEACKHPSADDTLHAQATGITHGDEVTTGPPDNCVVAENQCEVKQPAGRTREEAVTTEQPDNRLALDRVTQENQREVKSTSSTALETADAARLLEFMLADQGVREILFGHTKVPSADEVEQFVDGSLYVAFHLQMQEIDGICSDASLNKLNQFERIRQVGLLHAIPNVVLEKKSDAMALLQWMVTDFVKPDNERTVRWSGSASHNFAYSSDQAVEESVKSGCVTLVNALNNVLAVPVGSELRKDITAWVCGNTPKIAAAARRSSVLSALRYGFVRRFMESHSFSTTTAIQVLKLLAEDDDTNKASTALETALTHLRELFKIEKHRDSFFDQVGVVQETTMCGLKVGFQTKSLFGYCLQPDGRSFLAPTKNGESLLPYMYAVSYMIPNVYVLPAPSSMHSLFYDEVRTIVYQHIMFRPRELVEPSVRQAWTLALSEHLTEFTKSFDSRRSKAEKHKSQTLNSTAAGKDGSKAEKSKPSSSMVPGKEQTFTGILHDAATRAENLRIQQEQLFFSAVPDLAKFKGLCAELKSSGLDTFSSPSVKAVGAFVLCDGRDEPNCVEASLCSWCPEMIGNRMISVRYGSAPDAKEQIGPEFCYRVPPCSTRCQQFVVGHRLLQELQLWHADSVETPSPTLKDPLHGAQPLA